MSITISHSAPDGTLVTGTTRGDGTNTILKACGFRWFPSLSLWGIAGSRDRHANHHKINNAAEQLRAAGHNVEVDINDTQRPTAEVEADRIERQSQRAEALEAKAQRKDAAADAAWEAQTRAVNALPPGGEPIKIGHHSERRHRNAIDKAHRATGKAIAASDDAKDAHARAQTAATTTAHRYNPKTVKNRIDKLEAEHRADQRTLDGHRRVIARTANGDYVDEIPAAQGEYRQRVSTRMAERADQITYWKQIYSQQQAAGIANTYGPDTIAVGDRIQYGRSWYTVVRANPKSVSVRLFEQASWTNTIRYHDITGHQPAEQTPKSRT